MNDSTKSIAILMCTFNGGIHLEQQLESLKLQSYQNWRLFISDDGSCDNTIMILERYQRAWGSDKLDIRYGPGNDYVSNFLNLVCDPMINADLYAFCDQDDIWLPEKLSRAAEFINNSNIEAPSLYCSRTRYIDAQGNFLGESRRFDRPLTFNNALVQSIAGGNTMVFSRALKNIIQSLGPVRVSSHDWWLYLLVTGIGGEVYFDQNITVEYRQHANSLVGENRSVLARIRRACGLLSGELNGYVNLNLSALEKIKDRLTPENLIILEDFIYLRNCEFSSRIKLIRTCGLYRQSRLDTLGLYIAAALKKL